MKSTKARPVPPPDAAPTAAVASTSERTTRKVIMAGSTASDRMSARFVALSDGQIRGFGAGPPQIVLSR
jgi:hypothetical protein